MCEVKMQTAKEMREQQDKRPVPEGNLCPYCGNQLVVYQTVRGRVRTVRVHKCSICGEVFSSTQTYD
jgi:transcription elongation factor Elf1